VEAIYNTNCAVELEAAALGSFVARTDFVTVYGLTIEEVPQPTPSEVGIINVTGCCAFADGISAGLCVMMVGCGPGGQILWACCLRAHPHGKGPQTMLESLLVPSEDLGKTQRVVVRVSGVRLSNENAAVSRVDVHSPHPR